MENHFVKNIYFKNFKCFEELEFDGLKRVNLIGGKNNVGKTSFMEGVNLAVSSNDSLQLSAKVEEMIFRRQIKDSDFEIDFFYNDTNIINIIINKKNIFIEYIDEMNEYDAEYQDDIEYVYEYIPHLNLQLNEDKKRINIHDMLGKKLYVLNKKDDTHFIYSSKISEYNIAVFYSTLINLGKEDYIDNSLKIFDENIVGLRQIFNNKVTLKLKLKDREKPVLLSSFGEGINRYIAIICAIWASKDGYLFIDEIENGIHYTNYPKLWKLIFDISKEANCQIFAATHSKECIEAFNKENKDNEGLYLEFYRNQKTGLINIKDRDNEQLEYALLNNGEFRGE